METPDIIGCVHCDATFIGGADVRRHVMVTGHAVTAITGGKATTWTRSDVGTLFYTTGQLAW